MVLLSLFWRGAGMVQAIRGAEAVGVYREVFSGITGGTVFDLTNSLAFPDGATSSSVITGLFETASNVADNYGQRLRAVLVAPFDGNYTFYIASDDQSVLYLSTDENPANKRLIAAEPQWNSIRDYTGTAQRTGATAFFPLMNPSLPANRSDYAFGNITLEAGERYYIEVLMKEGGGGDHVSVAWTVPGGGIPSVPISASHFRAVNAPPPTITQLPSSISVSIGEEAAFSITASGLAPLIYQWLRNGVNIPGADGPSYTIPSVTPADGGTYSVKVQNPVGLVASQSVVLEVFLGQVELVDNFADRVALPDDNNAGFASSVGATLETDEPQHAGKPNAASVWAGWQPSAAGIATVRTSGSDFDTVLAVYTGTALNNLVEQAADEDSGGFHTSSARFNVTAGTDYHIAVAGYDGASGRIVLSWSLEPTTEQVPEITTHPQSRTAPEGSNLAFVVAATGTEPLAYQWHRNGVALSGETGATLSFDDLQRAAVGSYFVRVRNGSGRELDSRSASLELGLDPNIRSEDKLRDLAGSPPVGPTLQDLRPRPRPAGAFTVAAGIPGSQLFSTFGATAESGEPDNANRIGGTSRWFELEVTSAATLLVDTIGSDFDTTLGLYRGADLVDLVTIAEDDNSAPDRLRSRVVVTVATPGKYLVKVDGSNGQQGLAQLNWALGTGPAITRQPTGGIAPAGGSFPLSVTATGVPPPAYQWFQGANQIENATTDVWTLAGLTAAATGRYRVQVTNPLGTVDSSWITVVVDDGTVMRFAPNAVFTGGNFDLQFAGPPGVEIVIYASTNLLQWAPVRTNSGAFTFRDPSAANHGTRFYKTEAK